MKNKARQVWEGGKVRPMAPNEHTEAEKAERRQNCVHTPGPWEINCDLGSPYIVGTEWRVATIDSLLDGINNAAKAKEQMANARLIAAAPDLLEASKKFLAFYNDLARTNPGFMAKLGLQDYAQWNTAMIELPAAIAKAEGRQP